MLNTLCCRIWNALCTLTLTSSRPHPLLPGPQMLLRLGDTDALIVLGELDTTRMETVGATCWLFCDGPGRVCALSRLALGAALSSSRSVLS